MSAQRKKLEAAVWNHIYGRVPSDNFTTHAAQ
jgi:hypothetical protein